MSDQILSDLLHRSAENVPASEAPITDLLHRGNAIKHRRHRAAVVGAVVASLIVVGAIAAGQRSTQRVSQPADQPTGLPAPPAGMKWVGVGRTVVALPQGWPVVPGIYCQGPIERYATITQWRVTVGCEPMSNGHGGSQSPTAVDIEGNASGDFVARIEGSEGSGRVAKRSLDASTTTLPDGWFAVPSGEPFGGAGLPTLTSEIAALKAAGFQVVRKHATSDGRWQPVTTYPEIGTPARLGSTVVVYDHGAVASSDTLTGRLQWVGGPAPGSPAPHPGTIHVVNADGSIDQTTQAEDTGAWEIYLPPGTYIVRATSPGYGSTSGTFDGCSATRDRVTVRANETITVDVYCQLD
jgi:hypothetical protein